jgi:iron complex outermembrane receptor protein
LPTIPRLTLRHALLGATALAMSATVAAAQVPANTVPSGIAASAGNATTPNATGNTAGAATTGSNSETITVRAQRQLLREKNSPSAVTELGAAQIQQTGVQGSVATLLRAAPSVNVYQQGIGNNEPVISIRGARGL